MPTVVRRRTLLALTLLAVTVAGCSGDAPAGGDAPGSPNPTATATPDVREEALLTEVRSLRETVATARRLLEEAAAGDTAAAGDAVAALTADDRLAEGSVDVAPLFPGPLSSRAETIDYGDAFSRTLTAARESGGQFGVRISQVLADPIAGDLGIWQRDAEGLLDAVDDAARPTSVAEAEQAVLELPGEGTRALAFALLAARAGDGADVRAYAERAIAHLDVVLRALDDALDSTEEDA